MISENLNLTTNIEELNDKYKNLPDRPFYLIDSSSDLFKVSTKTEELAIEYVKAYEATVYDNYGGDTWSEDDTWGWWNHKDAIEIIDKSKIKEDDEIYDLDNYDFTWCEYPPIIKIGS